MDYTNYTPCFYYLPEHQYNIMDVPNCLTPTLNLEEPKLVKQEESNPHTQVNEEIPSSPSVVKLNCKEGESSSLPKFSKATLKVPQKKESYSNVVAKNKEVKLEFRIEWKNENRNIVPNLINQMISYILKKIKSQKLVHQIFKALPHETSWT